MRWSDQAGTVAPEFAAGVGFLVLPVVVLVLSLPGWFEARHAGRVAAAQAAREAATAPNPIAAATGAAAIVDRLLADHGVEAAKPLALITTPPTSGGVETVTASVTVRVPALQLPFVGPVAGFDHTVRHTQPLDRYRATPGGGP